MDITRYLLVLVGMVMATFVSRYPMLYYAGRRELPESIRHVLQYVPPAVLIAITVPTVLLPDGEVALSPSNEYLVAAIVTSLFAWRTKRTLLSIAAGMLTLWACRFLIGLFFPV